MLLKIVHTSVNGFQFFQSVFAFAIKRMKIGQDFDFEINHFTYIIGIFVLWTHVYTHLYILSDNDIDMNLNKKIKSTNDSYMWQEIKVNGDDDQ